MSDKLTLTDEEKEYLANDVLAVKETTKSLSKIDPYLNKKFIEIVVEYLPPELCCYIEYVGKPYFSIKYKEHGKTYTGYGTYKPEILSHFLKEYFMQSVEHEITEDEVKSSEAEIQKITDKYVEEIDKIVAAKEKEVMQV